MRLSSVVIPCLASDRAAFERLMRLWSDPRFSPYEDPLDQPDIQLIVVLNNAAPDERDGFVQSFEEFPALRTAFAGIEIFDAQLEAEQDIYRNDDDRVWGRFGNKAGPNLLFFKSMEIASGFDGFTLLNELDCFPVLAGWLGRLSELVASHSQAWVIGSAYVGETPLEPRIQWHLNGNAIYKTGDRHFMKFVREVWKPRLLQLATVEPDLAYDCWFETERSLADNGRRNRSWEIVVKYQGYFAAVPYLVNCLPGDDPITALAATVLRTNGLSTPPLLAHGHIFSGIVEGLLADPSLSFEEQYARKTTKLSSMNETDLPTFEDDVAQHMVVSRWPLTSGLFAPDMADFPVLPIDIEESCFIATDDIDDRSFVGAWHGREAGLRWMGQGSAALPVRVPKGTTGISVSVSGHPAKSDEPPPITVHVVTGGRSSSIPLNADAASLHCCDVAPDTAEFWLLFRAESAVAVSGDSRDLAYALFGISFQLVR